MNIDTKNIEKLLAEKKYAEVGKIISDAATAPMSSDEKGAALTGVATVYMDVMNNINIQYRDSLKEAIEAMKKLNKAELGMKDKIAVDEIKGQLNMAK